MIWILFTTDAWKSHASRVLRGAFTSEELMLKAKETIKSKLEYEEDKIDVITLENNECQTDGGYF
jgi:hypothetical protein